MTLSVAEIASLVGGRLESGDGSAPISGVASLAEAQLGDLSFFSNPKYLADLKTSKAGAVLIRPGLDFSFSGAVILVENPSLAFATALEKLRPAPILWKPGIHPSAVIGIGCQIDPTASIQPLAVIEDGASIGAGTVIGAHAYVGHDTVIGRDCLIHPSVTIRERTKIGCRVIIHSGAVIGSDGFGYETVQGVHQKIPQTGVVQIDDDVEVGAGTTIDRARFGRTWIGAGTKIDNLVQIAHNVVIGRHSIIVSQTGIAGSSRVGNYVVIAGQCGIVGHVTIGDQAVIGAGSGISKNIPPGEKWFGTYAEPMRDMMKKLALTSRLPELFDRVKALEKKSTAPGTAGEPPQ